MDFKKNSDVRNRIKLTAAKMRSIGSSLSGGVTLQDLDRLIILLYQFLFAEEARQVEAVRTHRQLMLMNEFDSYYVLKYYEAVRRYEDFIFFQKKVFILLRGFDKNLFNMP